MNLQTVIFIGRSGCGKGTQIEQFKNFLKNNDEREVFHLEAGDRFRNLINEKCLDCHCFLKSFEIARPECPFRNPIAQ